VGWGVRRRGWSSCWCNLLGKEQLSLTGFSKDLFVEATKRRRLMRFWLERGWIRDVSNFAYSKREGVGDFFGKWGNFGFRGVYRFVLDIGRVSGVVRWPNLNTNLFLVAHGDLKLGVSNKGVEYVVPPDEKPRVVDEFEG
jgi:hypothetical protein